MKVLVMGAGAVGGYFGGVLARRGEDVTLIARGEQLKAIRERGLRVESAAHGAFVVRPRAVERADGTWQADLVLYCVKSYDSPQAIEAMRPAVGPATTVLTLQNGVGSGDALAAAFGRGRVLLGAAYIEAMRKAPGVVAQAGSQRIVFGEEDGRRTPRALRVLDTLKGAGIDAVLSPDIHRDLWNKLIFICALSGMSCITRASFAEVLDTPETLELTWRVMREAEAVGRARGIPLDKDIVEATMAEFQATKQDLISSMYLDLQAGNPLELDVINGAVVRIGRELGVPTPVNEFIVACLRIANSRAQQRSA